MYIGIYCSLAWVPIPLVAHKASWLSLESFRDCPIARALLYAHSFIRPKAPVSSTIHTNLEELLWDYLYICTSCAKYYAQFYKTSVEFPPTLFLFFCFIEENEIPGKWSWLFNKHEEYIRNPVNSKSQNNFLYKKKRFPRIITINNEI